MKLLYPAIFYPFEDGKGYAVEVPDLPGCITEGYDLADAILMATDAASGWVLDELEDGKEPPKASDPSELIIPENGLLNLLLLDMDAYAEKYGHKAVCKNITIPAYMNSYIEERDLSLSKIVREAVASLISSEDAER